MRGRLADEVPDGVPDEMPNERPDDHELSERLQIVSEELAVADDELVAQQRQIDELLAREVDARQTLSAITRSVPVPVLVTDAAGGVVEANQAAGSLFGLAPGRLLRKPVQALIHPDDRGRARALVSQASSEGTAGGWIDITPRNGDRRTVRLAITAGGGSDHDGARTMLSWVVAPLDDPGANADGDQRPEEDAALQAVAELTTLPVADSTVHELLSRIASLATRAVEGADWTSVTLGDPLQPDEVAEDSEEAQVLDGAHWKADQGPAVDAHRDGVPVVSGDLTTDERWPELAVLAARTPIRSAMSLPIRVQDEVSGVLNVYGAAAGTFDSERQVDRGLVFADAVAAVLRDLQRVEELRSTAENLQIAMRSRATIEQAKGLVAGWLGCSVEDAFAALTTLSQDRNVKLRELAALAVADPGRHDLRPLLARAHARARRRAEGTV